MVMAFLNTLNTRVLYYAEHPYVLSTFCFLCFLSGSFLPFPIDPIFMVIAMRQPKRIALFVTMGAGFVTLGGLLMYGIGYSLYYTLGLWLINTYGWHDQFVFLKTQLDLYGAWFIVLKAFTPIPYKLLAMIAGIGHMNLGVFLIASFAGRFVRLAIEGLVIRFASPGLRALLEKHLSLGLGIFLLAFLVLTFCVFFLFRLKSLWL
jgi:membrane protein YqaA with SNARE-associated domain